MLPWGQEVAVWGIASQDASRLLSVALCSRVNVCLCIVLPFTVCCFGFFFVVCPPLCSVFCLVLSSEGRFTLFSVRTKSWELMNETRGTSDRFTPQASRSDCLLSVCVSVCRNVCFKCCVGFISSYVLMCSCLFILFLLTSLLVFWIIWVGAALRCVLLLSWFTSECKRGFKAFAVAASSVSSRPPGRWNPGKASM